jgi:hypothetical protein
LNDTAGNEVKITPPHGRCIAHKTNIMIVFKLFSKFFDEKKWGLNLFRFKKSMSRLVKQEWDE